MKVESIKPGNRTIVLTNYRTGSTSFVSKNCNKNTVNHWEIVNTQNRKLHNIPKILKNSRSYIAKIMPDQLQEDWDYLDKFIECCDQVVYLYRKDFTAQCLSWIAMQHLKDWSVRPQGESNWIEHTIDINQQFADEHTEVIRSNNDALQTLYKKYPGKVYAYEDIQDNDPYRRKYNWIYTPHIEPYNTGAMFND